MVAPFLLPRKYREILPDDNRLASGTVPAAQAVHFLYYRYHRTESSPVMS
jgi:hypothetical protein